MFCSIFSKFASSERANVRGIPPVQDHPPRAPSATCAAYSMPELIEQKYFKQTRPKLVSASGQRTQGVQGQARHWHVKGIKLKKLADSLEMAPLSPTGTRRRRSRSVTRLRRSRTFLRIPPSPSPPLACCRPSKARLPPIKSLDNVPKVDEAPELPEISRD
jgi:hypothetical protein